MRVLLISSQIIPHVGGLSTHFQLLERTLRKNGMLAGVITGRDCSGGLAHRVGLCVSRLVNADAALRRALNSSLERLSEALGHVLQNHGAPDLIHCHDPLAAVAAHQTLGGGTSIPVIQTVHGPWSREALMGGAVPGGAQVTCIRRLEETAFSTASHFIPVDSGQAEILVADFRVPVDRISVIPNGVDTAAVAALSEMRLRRPGRQPYFVVPRRLVKKNGVEVALRALARRQSQAVLVVAGDGPLRAQLERTTRALNIVNRVRFLGNAPPRILLPLMRRALGVVIPSIPADGVVEATSLAALESMACGTPILVSEIGGLREIVSRADVGFLFAPGDDAAFAAGMQHIEEMRDDELALLRRRTRQAAELFALQPWFDRIHAVYQNTLRAANSPAQLVHRS
jgi:glycosyltransferase involved in cell wall biosynthesis